MTTTPAAPTPSGPPPNFVGHSLATAETQLQASGYSTTAHPWGAACPTQGLVMQQVPPQDDNVQLYYCVDTS